jgi:hypothetical protein
MAIDQTDKQHQNNKSIFGVDAGCKNFGTQIGWIFIDSDGTIKYIKC